MFEQELELLTTTIQSRTIGSRGNVTLQEILAADIPQSMHHYFRKGVEEKFAREWKETENASRFSYKHSSVQKIKRELQSALTMNYAFSRKEFLDALDDGIHLTLNYLVRPQWTMLSFIFNNRDTISSEQLLVALKGFSEYDYIREIANGVIEASKMQKFSQEEFRLLLENLDREYFKRRKPNEVVELLKSLFNYLSFGTKETNAIPIQALVKYFDDKHLSNISARLRDKIDSEKTETISQTELLKLLEESFLKNGGFISKEEYIPSSITKQTTEVIQTSKTIESEIEETQISTAPTEEEVLALLTKPTTSVSQITTEEVEEIFAPTQDERSFLYNKKTTIIEDKPLYDETAGPLFESQQEIEVLETAETRNEIRSLISERMKNKFVKKIFRKDEQRYEQAIDTLNSFSTWSEAAREIGNIFIANEIDPYSSVAVKFTEVVHSRFRK